MTMHHCYIIIITTTIITTAIISSRSSIGIAMMNHGPPSLSPAYIVADAIMVIYASGCTVLDFWLPMQLRMYSPSEF